MPSLPLGIGTGGNEANSRSGFFCSALGDKGDAEPRLTYVGSLSMAEHRFRVGDLVRVQGSISKQPDAWAANVVTLSRSSGIHEVTRLLPLSLDGEPLYQVRGSGGQRERVVRESELAPAVHFPQPRC